MPAPRLKDDWRRCLCGLQPGWDSYEAKQISDAALATVGEFRVVPLSRGGVQLEVHQDGFDVEIEINPDGRIRGALVTYSN